MNSDLHDDWSNEIATMLLPTPLRRASFESSSAQLFDHIVNSDPSTVIYKKQNAFEVAEVAAPATRNQQSIEDSITYSLFNDMEDLHAWALQHTVADTVHHEDRHIPVDCGIAQSLEKSHNIPEPINEPLAHSTPKCLKYWRYDDAHESNHCSSTDVVNTPTNVGVAGQVLFKPSTSGDNPDHFGGSEEHRQLQLVFLPAQKDTTELSTKYAKVAEIIQLKDGIMKLFVERGRVIETRISVTPSVDLDLSRGQSLRLRFLPYSSLGGVHRPVVGHENAVQPGHFSQIRQLCFVQLSDGSGHTYEKDENGYLYVETPLLGACTIHQLVFPFLNSQCPTARRTEVYVRVTVIRSDGSELCETTFQVVSCASPYRDANRFRLRHCNGDTSSIDNHAPPSDLDLSERGNWRSEFKTQNTARPELDISPSSSGFVSWCSPGTNGIQEEDSMPTIDAILSDHPSRLFSIECTGYRHSENSCQQSNSECDEAELASERTAFSSQLDSLKECDLHFISGGKRVMSDSSSHPVPSKRAVHSHWNENCTNNTARDLRSINMSGADSDQACEYTIKTKSRRVYEILFTLHAKLMETFGDI